MRRYMPLLIGALAFSSLSSLGVSRADAVTLGPVSNPANGHDYYVTDDILTWTGAEAWAVALGGHLVAINGAAEQDWVMTNVPILTDLLWIGARDDANTTDAVFAWVTGEPWSYTNWTPGEPDDNAGSGGGGDYVLLVGFAGTWLDMPDFFPFAGGIAEVVSTAGVSPGAGGSVRLLVQSVAIRGASTVRFDLPQATRVRLTIFDVSGRPVRTLFTGSMDAGHHDLTWDTHDEQARPVGSGLYFVALEAQGLWRTGRVVVAR